VNEAIELTRQTRAKIDPKVLKTARDSIEKAMLNHIAESPSVEEQGVEPVDMKKNLSIIMKYLEIRPEHKAVQSEVRSFLTQH